MTPSHPQVSSVGSVGFILLELFVYTHIHGQLSKHGNEASDGPIRVRRRNRLQLAVQVLGLLLLILGLSAPSIRAGSPRRVEVIAKRFAFEPAEITLKIGEPIDLVLASSDVNHGVRFRELGLDLRVAKGKKAEISFTPKATGTFVGHCSVFCGSGHGQMTLTIHVVA